MKKRGITPTRLTTRDWRGDGVVTIVLGALLAAAVWLPWAANPTTRTQNFNWSLLRADDILGTVHTPWGPRVLAVAALVVALGALVAVTRPRRWIGQATGLVLTAAALGMLANVGDGMSEAYAWGYATGPGILLVIIVAMVLPIVGLATAVTGRLLDEQRTGDDGTTAAGGGPAVTLAVIDDVVASTSDQTPA